MTFTEWLTSSAATAMGVAIIGFLARHLLIERLQNAVKNEYAKDLESHKANLRRDYDVQIERMKAELAQQHFRFSQVFETTEKVIAKIYVQLLGVLDAAENFTEEIQDHYNMPTEAHLKRLKDSFDEFFKTFTPNKIYIPRDTMIQILALTNTVQMLLSKHTMLASLINSKPTSEQAQSILDGFYKDISVLEQQIPDLLRKLEDDFQRILGFPIEKSANPK